MIINLSLPQAMAVIGWLSSLAAAAPFQEEVSQPFLVARDSSNYTHTLANGGTWTSGFAKAQSLVEQMTIEEKVNVTTG